MSIRVIRLELDEKLCRDLEKLAAHFGIGGIEDALRAAAAEWAAGRKAEVAENDPNERYFVNQALDELIAKKR
jgi:hypothetical protein